MRLAFITPRYGAEIAGDAERACRLLAEHLSRRHDVDVLTTTARDARTWRAGYAEGADRVRRVHVRRFAVSPGHDPAALERIERQVRTAPPTRADAHAWVRALGPSSAGLIDYLRRQHGSYDALVSFGLHPLTVAGLEIAPRQSVLFPCVRPRPALRFELWADALSGAAGVGFLSNAERQLVRAYVGVAPRHDEVVGVGVDPPSRQSYPRHQQDPADAIATEHDEATGEAEEEDGPADYLSTPGIPFRRRHRLYGDFALYGGRVAPDNGSEELIEYYDTYAASGHDLPLVLMGFKMLKVPEAPYLRLSGVLPDRERVAAYEAASVTIAPGTGDLLAESTLESLAVGTPVLASTRNPAAADHCREAGAGLCYANREEFVEALALLSRRSDLRRQMSTCGRRYVRQHHQWDAVMARFERLVGRAK